jgi:hypothetical protein
MELLLRAPFRIEMRRFDQRRECGLSVVSALREMNSRNAKRIESTVNLAAFG